MIIERYRGSSDDIQPGDDPHEVIFWADETSPRWWYVLSIRRRNTPHLKDVFPVRIVLRQAVTVEEVEIAITEIQHEAALLEAEGLPQIAPKRQRPQQTIVPHERYL